MPGRSFASSSGDKPRLPSVPGPVALREHVGLAHQPAQGFEVLRLAQIEMRRELAVAGVVFLVAEIRQMRAGDLQHVGAVLGQRAGAGRPGEDARQVEHPDAGERPVALGQRFRRASPILTISISGSEAIAAACGCLAHSSMRAHHAARALGGDDRLLELERVPLRHRLAHRVAILRNAEHAQRGGAMVREIAVDIAPAAVLRRIDAHHRVALGRHRRAVHLQVMAAAQRRGGVARYRPRPPAAPGAQLPQIGDREPGRGERGGARLADPERRRQYRIGAAGDLDAPARVLGPAGDRQDGAQRFIDHVWIPGLFQLSAGLSVAKRSLNSALSGSLSCLNARGYAINPAA